MNPEERRYYDLRAPDYDSWYLGVGAFAERERPGWNDETRRLQRFVAGLPAGRTLDVACGTGFLTRHLAGDVTGLDQSEAMIRIARERGAAARLVVGDALSLPFDDGSFDLVFAGHFYGHLRDGDPERFLAEARRVAPALVVVDSAPRHGEVDGLQERVLPDGSRHRVYKRFFTAAGLADEIGGEPVFAGDWYVAAAA